jgi:hypothetical protein
MGSVIDFANRRQARRPGSTAPTPISGQHVRCAQCGERHPVVRLKAGESRCVSAFFDGTHWFCLHGGCRREWLARNGEPTP